MFAQKHRRIETRHAKGHHDQQDNHLHRIESAVSGKGEERGRAEIPFQHIEDEKPRGLRRQMQKPIHKTAEKRTEPIQKSRIHGQTDHNTAYRKGNDRTGNGQKGVLDDRKQRKPFPAYEIRHKGVRQRKHPIQNQMDQEDEEDREPQIDGEHAKRNHSSKGGNDGKLRRARHEENEKTGQPSAGFTVVDELQGSQRRRGTPQTRDTVKKLTDKTAPPLKKLTEQRKPRQNLPAYPQSDHDGKENQKQIPGRHGQKTEVAEQNPAEKIIGIIHLTFFILSKDDIMSIHADWQGVAHITYVCQETDFMKERGTDLGITEIIMIAIGALTLILLLLVYGKFAAVQKEIKDSRVETIQYINEAFKNYGQLIAGNQKEVTAMQDKRLAELGENFSRMALENEQKLENIRTTMSTKIGELTADNNKQLEQMRQTVDEKLQKTLEDRIGQSFKVVSERLEEVYKGLGEMQTLATGVGDLKKVLSNVKTRGILGEIQLGAILEQILSPDQYEENITTRSTGNERVEYAVKLPGDDDRVVYLPIDAKFPADAYSKLADAYDAGDSAAIEAAGKNLEKVIKSEAKDIRDKYIEPPNTTDFGIMFLPFEGLYAEVVRRGLVETLQKDYKVNIAGPTTMAALLNSLQMGFRTLAIQKHSGEVWDILGAVKNEFGKFEDVLTAAQKKINQANDDLDKLVGTRSRMIRSKLRKVTSLTDDQSAELLDFEEK